MAEKQILTNREIEKDIATAIRYPADMQEKSYKGQKPVAIVIAMIAFVVELIKPQLLLWTLLGVVVCLIAWAVARYFGLKYKARQVSIDGYEITVEILHSKDHERYFMRGSGRYGRGKTVYNYTWRFENGQSWRMPTKIYLWSDLYSMAHARVHESIHRGDAVLVVTKKESGDVVMAYPAEIFVYRK